MIEIVITQTITTEFETMENCVIEKIPTEQRHQGRYDNEPQVVYAEKSQPILMKKTKTETMKLLSQQIADDAAFDLPAVIRAINRLDV